jgi:hypothetical protein
MNTSTIYLIFVRPPGSTTWTQYMKSPDVPWRSSKPFTADEVAVSLANRSAYCVKVVSVKLPKDADDIDHPKYAILSDGDTLYVATPP